jgi:TPR repeat protein
LNPSEYLTCLRPPTGANYLDSYRAVAAYRNNDNTKAFQLFLPLAEQGNHHAQCYLGFMYEVGRGVLQDYKQAEYWYRKAAEQNDAEAQYYLGGMYYWGEGLVRDYKQAEIYGASDYRVAKG